MGSQKICLEFSLTKAEVEKLLLLCGHVASDATHFDGEEKTKVTFYTISHHRKHGEPGIEDGSNHIFKSMIEYKDGIFEAKGAMNSQDGGETYQGSISFDHYQDNMSE